MQNNLRSRGKYGELHEAKVNIIEPVSEQIMVTSRIIFKLTKRLVLSLTLHHPPRQIQATV